MTFDKYESICESCFERYMSEVEFMLIIPQVKEIGAKAFKNSKLCHLKAVSLTSIGE